MADLFREARRRLQPGVKIRSSNDLLLCGLG
jgi:hypothetical protein